MLCKLFYRPLFPSECRDRSSAYASGTTLDPNKTPGQALGSHSVTATIIIPIMIALAVNIGVEPLSITMPAALTASMAFILVTSSPTNVIPYSAGYFSIKDMAIAASIIVSAVIYLIGSFTGLY